MILHFFQHYGHAYGAFQKTVLVCNDQDQEIARYSYGNNGNFMCGMAGDGVNWKSQGAPFSPDLQFAMMIAKENPVATRYGAEWSGRIENMPEGVTEEEVTRYRAVQNAVERSRFDDGNNYLEVAGALLRREQPPEVTFVPRKS